MQLLDHTRAVLRDCVSSVEVDLAHAAPDDILAAESSLTLQPADGIEEEASQLRVKVKRARGKAAPDWNAASEAIADFTGSTLNFAFNPLVRGEPKYAEEDAPVSVEEGTTPNSISIVGPASAMSKTAVSDALKEIDLIEKRMFRDWQASGPTIVEKTFDSPEECERITHLLVCMAQSFGYDEKKLEKVFHPADDERTIRMDKKFLETLIKRELTLEATIETERM